MYMDINLIALAIPVFLISMAIEYGISVVRKERVYYLNDFANNLSCGVIEQASTLPLQGLLLFSYDYLYHYHRLFSLNPQSIYAWFFLWLGVDFCYYWFHRASHRCVFLWAGHAVHHQSEQYNLSVALRQGVIQTLFAWIIYLPLALLGFPTWMFVLVVAANTLYQFWIHTKLIKTMGWFELVFNTPSHHRVHHGKNPLYIDKNYAGSLIIWDRLFGTFEPETIAADYGTTEPLLSWNPYYANVKVFSDTFRYGKNLPSLRQRVSAFIMPPEWIVKQLSKPLSPSKQSSPQNFHYPTAYILFNLFMAISLFVAYIASFNPHSPLSWMLLIYVFSTLYVIGLVLNRGVIINIKYTELFRSILILIIAHLLFQNYLIDFVTMMLFFILNIVLYKKRKP